MKTKTLNINFSEATRDKLEYMRYKFKKSMACIIKEALEDYFKKHLEEGSYEDIKKKC